MTHDVNSILLTESFVTASDSLPMDSESLENNSVDKEVKKKVTENIENNAEELDEDSEDLFPRTQTKEFVEPPKGEYLNQGFLNYGLVHF